jgi:type IV pilus assembly protein PilO
MAQAGLRKRSLLLSARGTYPQLLAFLRRMELLDVLVEQSNLSVAVAGAVPGRPTTNNKELPPVVPKVEAKLALTLYSKEEKKAEPPPAGAATKGQPKKAPVPPG